jgi:hypothetical protein
LASSVCWRAPFFAHSVYCANRSHERDGRDAHKPMKKKIMASVWPISAFHHYKMTVDLSSFAASSLATPGFSKTAIAKPLPALANREHHCGNAAACARADADARPSVVQDSRPCFARFSAIFGK